MTINRIQRELFDMSLSEDQTLARTRRPLRELYGLHGIQHTIQKLRKMIYSCELLI